MSQGKQQPQHLPAVDPAFWNITSNSKPGEFESGMIKMLYSTGIDLQKENQALKNHIKQLEDAGDALERDKQALKKILADMGVVGSMGFGSTVKWVQAKEDKL